MRCLVAQLGARRHYAVPRALAEAGRLERLFTDAYADVWPFRLLDRGLPPALGRGPLRRLADRRSPEIRREQVRCCLPLLLLQGRRWISSWRGPQDSYTFWIEQNRRFGEWVVRQDWGCADTAYAFNGAAVEIFGAARRRGLRCVLDQTMAPHSYVERVLAEERARWPEWAPQEGADHAWQGLAEREVAEWELAHLIITGSPFVVETLRQESGRCLKCAVAPHVPPREDDLAAPRFPATHGKGIRKAGGLNVLFAGTLELRKGIQYVWGAGRRLASSAIRFRFVGPIHITARGADCLRTLGEVVGAVPRSEMDCHYRWADVVVLPTLAEGSANVCLEALAYGVPVVTTPCAGVAIRDGDTGRLIPPRDEAAIACILDGLAAAPSELEHLRQGAWAQARAYAEESYGKTLLHALDEGLTWVKPLEVTSPAGFA